MSEAGGSAQREYDRRKARERAVIKSNLVWAVPLLVLLSIVAQLLAERHLGMGWIAFAVVGVFLGLQFWGTSAHITAYGKGAEGERRTDRSLQKIADYTLLAERRRPCQRIEHKATQQLPQAIPSAR